MKPWFRLQTLSFQQSTKSTAVTVDETVLGLVGVVAEVDPIVLHHLLHLPLGRHAQHLWQKIFSRISNSLASHIGTKAKIEKLDDLLEKDLGQLVVLLARKIVKFKMF